MVNLFLAGAITLGYLICFLFFARFWKKSGDWFFLIFSLAFLFLAVERVVIAFFTPRDEVRPFVFLIRLMAFLLILIAIAIKNRSKG